MPSLPRRAKCEAFSFPHGPRGTCLRRTTPSNPLRGRRALQYIVLRVPAVKKICTLYSVPTPSAKHSPMGVRYNSANFAPPPEHPESALPTRGDRARKRQFYRAVLRCEPPFRGDAGQGARGEEHAGIFKNFRRISSLSVAHGLPSPSRRKDSPANETGTLRAERPRMMLCLRLVTPRLRCLRLGIRGRRLRERGR